MVGLFTKGWRKTLGALVVALYALCILLPTGAIAASHSPVSQHCLGEHHHALGEHQQATTGGEVYDHAGAPHDGPADHNRGQNEKCCGLFGVTALAPEFQAITMRPTPSSGFIAPLAESLFSNNGDRIDRPPRGRLS